MLTATAVPEAVFVSSDHIEGFDGCIVIGFGLGGRDVSYGLEQPVVVKSVDPAQRCHFQGRHARQ